jgi:hypothetical protein
VVLHKPSRFITELPSPEVDADGTTTGLYEAWQLELVAPEQLPPPPGERAPRLGDGSTSDDDDRDDALERHRMEN